LADGYAACVGEIRKGKKVKRNVDSENCFKPMYGKPCWNAGYGRYENLYMHFGKPDLTILEPRTDKKITRVNFLRYQRRRICVTGEWKFFLNVAYFRILRKGILVASSSSSYRQIRKAVNWLEGQKLIGAEVDNRTGKTELEFDIDGFVEIRRTDADSQYDLWFLFGPTYSCNVKGDGTFEWKKRRPD
jgi:hypothetical protein